MRFTYALSMFLLMTGTALAQATPNNITVNCFFEGAATKGAPGLRCHSVTNVHLVGEAEDHFLVNCPGLGQATIVFNDEPEIFTNGAVVIEPDGAASRPRVTLPGDAFNCRQNPTTFDARLDLPAAAPYNGAALGGECLVVTAGCGGPTR